MVSESDADAERINELLKEVSLSLELTLEQLLEVYEPDEEMKKLVQSYQAEWKKKKLRFFFEHFFGKKVSIKERPNFYEYNMEPFNILARIQYLYEAKEK